MGLACVCHSLPGIPCLLQRLASLAREKGELQCNMAFKDTADLTCNTDCSYLKRRGLFPMNVGHVLWCLPIVDLQGCVT